MEQHIPAIVILAPLVSALLITMLWWSAERWCFPLALAATAVSLAAATALLAEVLAAGVVEYRLGGWSPPYGIVFRIDHLNGLILVFVALVSTLNLAGARTLAARAFQEKAGAFYALYLLFTTGLLGILVTGDAFNLFVLLEIASLTGYALIGLGPGRAPLAGLNYLFLGTIGASLYLLGIGCLYLVTGSLNMVDIAAILPAVLPSRVVLLAFVLCLGGLFLKMALFPLHAWLPNAYAYAPDPVSSLVAPLTTKVMLYAMFRLTLTVFTVDFAFELTALRLPIMALAVVAIVMGSIMALAQKRLKKMLAFIVVAEVGYMVGGFWLGNRTGMTGAVLHLINDMVMTLCVFMAAGALVLRFHDDRISSLRGSFRTMPVSMAAMVLGGLSLIGVPPTCGFFSKWYLIVGGLEAGRYLFVAALIFSSLVNLVLFFRIIETGFFQIGGPNLLHRGHSGGGFPVAALRQTEAPLELLAALGLTALLIIGLGLSTGVIVTGVIDRVIPAAFG